MSEVLTAVRAGASGNIGSEATPARLGNGLFWAESTDIGSGQKEVVITGMQGSGRYGIELIVDTGGAATTPMFPSVVFSDEQLSIDSNQLIDSYDSSLGSYASQAVNLAHGATHANQNGSVGSNAGIVVSSNTKIFGDATPGPSYSVSLDSGVVVTGSTIPAPAPVPLPVLSVPSTPSSGNYTVSGTKTIAAGSYAYGTLKLNENAHLIVEGPADIVVSSTFETGEDSTLEIDAANGPITFYCQGSFKYNEKTSISTASGSPADVAFVFDTTGSISFPEESTSSGRSTPPRRRSASTATASFLGRSSRAGSR